MPHTHPRGCKCPLSLGPCQLPPDKWKTPASSHPETVPNRRLTHPGKENSELDTHSKLSFLLMGPSPPSPKGSKGLANPTDSLFLSDLDMLSSLHSWLGAFGIPSPDVSPFSLSHFLPSHLTSLISSSENPSLTCWPRLTQRTSIAMQTSPFLTWKSKLQYGCVTPVSSLPVLHKRGSQTGGYQPLCLQNQAPTPIYIQNGQMDALSQSTSFLLCCHGSWFLYFGEQQLYILNPHPTEFPDNQ